MAGNRPIDRYRDGAGSAEIDPALGSIVAMVPAERAGRIYLLAEAGVVSGVTADRIDPDRGNAAIPWFVQRTELRHGVSTRFVRQTLGVAAALLDRAYLPERVDAEAAFALALRAAQHLEAVVGVVAALAAAHDAILAAAPAGRLDPARLPATPGLGAQTRQAIADLRAVQLATVELAEIFYPKPNARTAWDVSLVSALRAALPANDPVLATVDALLMPLRRIAAFRNAMIHPDATKRVDIADYDLEASGRIAVPTIAIVHPLHPLERCDIVGFLDRWAALLGDRFEALFAVLADRNARPIAGGHFVSVVVALPDEEPVRGARYRWETRFAAVG